MALVMVRFSHALAGYEGPIVASLTCDSTTFARGFSCGLLSDSKHPVPGGSDRGRGAGSAGGRDGGTKGTKYDRKNPS